MPGNHANDNRRSEAVTEILETETNNHAMSMSATEPEGEEPDVRAAGHDEGRSVEERDEATDSESEAGMAASSERASADAGEDMRRSA
jgi:hypothetical protein